MTTISPAPETTAPDATKHVKYTLGMILGADDFDQEFAWLSGRDRWLARDALGYGTLNGLQVTVRQDAGIEPQVLVSPGAALTPRGDLVRVTPAQCALLNPWLERHRGEITPPAGGSPAIALPIYVVLCYATCETDARPIPGEPCRSEAENMAASRVADAFRLELRLTPPMHEEEQAIRAFVRWVADTVEIGDGPSTGTVEEFVDLLRGASASGSPPVPRFDPASPADRFVLDRFDACGYLRAALRVWITEMRPLWHDEFPGGRGCCGQVTPTPDAPEACLLLARLDVVLDPDGRVDGTVPIEIVEDDRPLLAHLRLLQEWAICGPAELGGGGGGPGMRGPRGDAGPTGEAGPAGPAGPQGPQGLAGPIGPTGPAGPAGAPGPPGPQGVTGAAGPAGAAGPIGAPGPAGAAGPAGVPGPQGPIGPAGPGGAPGPRGDSGAAGPAGSAGPIGPAGARGEAGPQGAAGVPGPAGAVGAPGPAGAAGPRGDAGPQGAAGPIGPPGPQGPPGLQGPIGVQGPQGTPGPIGAQGPQGAPGLEGTRGPQGAAGDPAQLLRRFVETPDVGMRYSIVAAGIVSAAQVRRPVFNNLRVATLGTGGGLVTLTFDRYRSPDGERVQYIVKVLPVLLGDQLPLLVNFVRFEDQGFVLRVTTAAGQPVNPDQMRQIELMVEVSQYIVAPQ